MSEKVYETLGQQYQPDISPELRKKLIKMAEGALEKKMAPLECYMIDTQEGIFMVSLGNRPPKVFFSDDAPMDMDCVFRIGERK